MNRLKAIIRKEIKQLSRDPRFLFVLFFFPVFLLIIFGYAVNFDVKNIRLAVYDEENSSLSRQFIHSLVNSGYFRLSAVINDKNDVAGVLDRGEAQVVMVVPLNFSGEIFTRGGEAKLQFLIDGVDGNTASIILNYTRGATSDFNMKIQRELLSRFGRSIPAFVELRPIFWFNPDLESTKFLIPGLIAMILIVTAVISVSLSLVREKERGTIEQLNVSAANSPEIILGKSFPYIIVSLIDAAFILIAGYVLFDIVVKGSYLLMFLSTLLFIIASVSIGIFISTIADTQQVAFTAATFASLLPSVILSGFIFPIESMPEIIQVFTNITPAKFYIVTLRSIILKGTGLWTIWDQLLYLMLFSVFFTLLAILTEKKKKDKN